LPDNKQKAGLVDFKSMQRISRVVRQFRPIPRDTRGRKIQRGTVEQVWVWFTDQVQDGDNYRWEYPWVEIYKASGGFDGWEELPDGRSGGNDGDAYGPAYNRVEDINNADLATSNPYGNGVVDDDISDTEMTLQPVPLNVPVLCDIVYPADGSNPELSFAYETGLTGGCS
jgi:hypothetical protein